MTTPDHELAPKPPDAPAGETESPPPSVPAAPPRAPAVADGRERSLDPGHVTVSRLGGLITVAILAALGFGGVLIVLVAADGLGLLGRLAALGVWIAAVALLAAFAFFWPPVSYRHTRYRVSEEGIEIRRGVFWREVTTIPRSRVQHTDVSQGPIERAFELSTLIVYTAGTQHASVHLSGLRHDTALGIRDFLLDGGDDDAV